MPQQTYNSSLWFPHDTGMHCQMQFKLHRAQARHWRVEKQAWARAEATRLHCLPCMPPSSQATVIALYGLQTHTHLHGNKRVLGNKSQDALYPFPW